MDWLDQLSTQKFETYLPKRANLERAEGGHFFAILEIRIIQILHKFLAPSILGTMNKTANKIIEYITKRGQASGRELADYFSITDRAVRKQPVPKWNRLPLMAKFAK